MPGFSILPSRDRRRPPEAVRIPTRGSRVSPGPSTHVSYRAPFQVLGSRFKVLGSKFQVFIFTLNVQDPFSCQHRFAADAHTGNLPVLARDRDMHMTRTAHL